MLPLSYVQIARKIATRRMALAGYRLASFPERMSAK
jgi:hypothetical protein